jgi:hypothetical protein
LKGVQRRCVARHAPPAAMLLDNAVHCCGQFGLCHSEVGRDACAVEHDPTGEPGAARARGRWFLEHDSPVALSRAKWRSRRGRVAPSQGSVHLHPSALHCNNLLVEPVARARLGVTKAGSRVGAWRQACCALQTLVTATSSGRVGSRRGGGTFVLPPEPGPKRFSHSRGRAERWCDARSRKRCARGSGPRQSP